MSTIEVIVPNGQPHRTRLICKYAESINPSYIYLSNSHHVIEEITAINALNDAAPEGVFYQMFNVLGIIIKVTPDIYLELPESYVTSMYVNWVRNEDNAMRNREIHIDPTLVRLINAKYGMQMTEDLYDSILSTYRSFTRKNNKFYIWWALRNKLKITDNYFII